MNKLKYFNDVRSEKSITKRYRELAKQFHPDNAKSDDELQKFTEIMKEINAEHQEVLVLLKHRAFATVEENFNEKPRKTAENKFLNKFFEQKTANSLGFSSLFSLTNQQKQELAEQGKSIINTFIDAIVENNLKK